MRGRGFESAPAIFEVADDLAIAARVLPTIARLNCGSSCFSDVHVVLSPHGH